MLVPLCFAQSNVGTKHALLLFSPVLFSFYILQLVCPLTYRLRFDEGIRALELDLDLRNGGRYVIGRIPLVRADALHDVVKGIRANKRDPSDYISATIAEIKVELKSSDAFIKAQAVSQRAHELQYVEGE